MFCLVFNIAVFVICEKHGRVLPGCHIPSFCGSVYVEVSMVKGPRMSAEVLQEIEAIVGGCIRQRLLG